MRRLALVVGLGMVLSAPSSAQTALGPQTASVIAWVAAVRNHHFGIQDQPAMSVAGWQESRIAGPLFAITQLADILSVANARDAKAGRLQPFIYNGRSFTRAQLLAALHLDP